MDEQRGKETERLREAVEDVRASVHETVNELSDRVHKATDVHEQVRSHPVAALAVAAVGGLIVGRQLTSLLGLGGIVALGASAALRATPASNGHVNVIVDRIINGVGAALASAVLVPVVSTIQRVIESSRAKGLPSTNSRASAVDSAADERGRVSVISHSRPGTADRLRL
jgi:hypothetical protein